MRKPEETEAEDWDEIDVSDQLDAEENNMDVASSPVAAPFELVDPASRAPDARPRPDSGGVKMASETRIIKQTVIEAGSEFKGTLKSSCAVVVNGTVDGQVDAPSLSVANTGKIHGTIKTKTLRSQGTLSASVDAEEVFLSGAIRSKTVIKTRRLEMKLASSNDSQLEVHFAASVLETSDVSVQLESPGAPPSRADSGWTILDAATAAGTSAPSPSKSSRRSEGLGRRR